MHDIFKHILIGVQQYENMKFIVNGCVQDVRMCINESN